jgi:hypothetical protein
MLKTLIVTLSKTTFFLYNPRECRAPSTYIKIRNLKRSLSGPSLIHVPAVRRNRALNFKGQKKKIVAVMHKYLNLWAKKIVTVTHKYLNLCGCRLMPIMTSMYRPGNTEFLRRPARDGLVLGPVNNSRFPSFPVANISDVTPHITKILIKFISK